MNELRYFGELAIKAFRVAVLAFSGALGILTAMKLFISVVGK